MTVGISRITDSLLFKIFYQLCERGPLSLRHLLFVSRRFHSVVVNNKHLWTTISIDPLFFHRFSQRPEQGDKYIEHCLTLSGSLPLRLHLDYSDTTVFDLAFLRHPLETFWKLGRRGFQRCTSLMWNADSYGATTIQRFADLLPKSLPSLTHISITGFEDPFYGSRFPNCPWLKRVEMLSHRTPSDFWGTNFQNVTTLSFGEFDYWADCDLDTLSLFPVLRDLKLFSLRRAPALDSDNPHLPITLEHLHIFRAHGYIPPAVLIKLVVPALEELHLKANYDGITSIEALQRTFSPPCEHIYALLPEAVSAREPEWATDLSKLVRRCTRTRSLYISKWMEKEYQTFMSGDGVVLHVQ